ncbi:hypothetical protein [Curtobacterium sp. MCSS17_007]|uniref:hypothetical protein n=1 Tax=Curtobacterium sp. MCSS17_007 TaxID=2175646 RepID=UPI000DA82F8B|nr:hypothetical protein [Curtobacterium sp. MCSS17_007]WIE76227.1 hypothetical protein DEJ22_002890 [Curtobacterium sp. MCSS17_007]
MPDSTPPLRFRTPPGWPTPSADWADLYEGAEPAAGWTPADDLPTAPAGWVFWVPTRVLRRSVGRGATAALVVGAAVTLASFLVLCVLWVADGPAVLALAPLIAGVALWVVGAFRYADGVVAAVGRVRDRSAARRADALSAHAVAAHPDANQAAALAASSADAWSVPSARPFVEGPPSRSVPRVQRVLVSVTAGVAAAVLVAGASLAVLPLVPDVQEVAAQVFGSSDPGAGGSDDPQQPEWSSDDGHTNVTWLAGDDEWEGTCDTTPGDATCDAYEIDTDRSCTAVVTVGFFTSADDDEPSRVEERTVALTADVPLVLVENHDEEVSDVGDVSCVTDGGADADRVSATQRAEDHVDTDVPAGCEQEGCVAFAVTAPDDCAAAAVQFRVAAAIGTVAAPHDLAVVTALRSGRATDVFVGGTDDASDVVAGGVTCRATDDTGSSQTS